MTLASVTVSVENGVIVIAVYDGTTTSPHRAVLDKKRAENVLRELRKAIYHCWKLHGLSQ